MNDLSDEELIQVLIALEEHSTKTAAAASLKLPVSTFKSRLKTAHQRGIELPEDYASKQSVVEKYKSEDIRLIQATGTQITTVDELVEHAKVDFTKFEIHKAFVRSWTTTMKLKRPEGKTTKEVPYQVPNYYISIELKRLAPKFIQDGIDKLLEGMPVYKGKTKSKPENPEDKNLLLELSLYDAHFGKLAWAEETGNNYDLKIAETIYTNAIKDLLEDAPKDKVGKILIPIGNDFFHANNWISQTVKGTRVESVDDRMSKVFEVGERAIVNAVIACAQVAPVKLIWVPGNHDHETSWYLMRVLKAHFKHTENVEVDLGEMRHKYETHGKVLLMFTHGETLKKKNNLPVFLATHCPAEIWANSKYREVHTGHIHTRKQHAWATQDEIHGIVWRTMASLSATDKWHFDNFYTGNLRAAESYLWHPEKGLRGINIAEARM